MQKPLEQSQNSNISCVTYKQEGRNQYCWDTEDMYSLVHLDRTTSAIANDQAIQALESESPTGEL